jgi:glycosyltransferase involved in cell wall biosynthesis
MSSPLVSVIVPVYNGERYLASALQSVFEQDYWPFEVIVVDDGSNDGSAAIAKSYPKVRYLRQSNQGVAVARNNGIEASDGELIALLDQDDLWVPNKLSRQVRHLLAHPELSCVISKVEFFLESGVGRPAWLKEELLSTSQSGYFPSALLARKTVFEKIGYFDPKYKAASDSDWFFRANNRGVLMQTLPDVLLRRRIHDANHSYQTQLTALELLRIARKSTRDRRAAGADEPNK